MLDNIELPEGWKVDERNDRSMVITGPNNMFIRIKFDTPCSVSLIKDGYPESVQECDETDLHDVINRLVGVEKLTIYSMFKSAGREDIERIIDEDVYRFEDFVMTFNNLAKLDIYNLDRAKILDILSKHNSFDSLTKFVNSIKDDSDLLTIFDMAVSTNPERVTSGSGVAEEYIGNIDISQLEEYLSALIVSGYNIQTKNDIVHILQEYGAMNFLQIVNNIGDDVVESAISKATANASANRDLYVEKAQQYGIENISNISPVASIKDPDAVKNIIDIFTDAGFTPSRYIMKYVLRYSSNPEYLDTINLATEDEINTIRSAPKDVPEPEEVQEKKEIDIPTLPGYAPYESVLQKLPAEILKTVSEILDKYKKEPKSISMNEAQFILDKIGLYLPTSGGVQTFAPVPQKVVKREMTDQELQPLTTYGADTEQTMLRLLQSNNRDDIQAASNALSQYIDAIPNIEKSCFAAKTMDDIRKLALEHSPQNYDELMKILQTWLESVDDIDDVVKKYYIDILDATIPKDQRDNEPDMVMTQLFPSKIKSLAEGNPYVESALSPLTSMSIDDMATTDTLFDKINDIFKLTDDQLNQARDNQSKLQQRLESLALEDKNRELSRKNEEAAIAKERKSKGGIHDATGLFNLSVDENGKLVVVDPDGNDKQIDRKTLAAAVDKLVKETSESDKQLVDQAISYLINARTDIIAQATALATEMSKPGYKKGKNEQLLGNLKASIDTINKYLPYLQGRSDYIAKCIDENRPVTGPSSSPLVDIKKEEKSQQNLEKVKEEKNKMVALCDSLYDDYDDYINQLAGQLEFIPLGRTEIFHDARIKIMYTPSLSRERKIKEGAMAPIQGGMVVDISSADQTSSGYGKGMILGYVGDNISGYQPVVLKFSATSSKVEPDIIDPDRLSVSFEQPTHIGSVRGASVIVHMAQMFAPQQNQKMVQQDSTQYPTPSGEMLSQGDYIKPVDDTVNNPNLGEGEVYKVMNNDVLYTDNKTNEEKKLDMNDITGNDGGYEVVQDSNANAV